MRYRRTREKPHQLPDRVLRLDGRDAYARALLRQRAEAKNDDAAGAADGLTVGEQIRETHLDSAPTATAAPAYALFLCSSSVLSNEFASSISCWMRWLVGSSGRRLEHDAHDGKGERGAEAGDADPHQRAREVRLAALLGSIVVGLLVHRFCKVRAAER